MHRVEKEEGARKKVGEEGFQRRGTPALVEDS